MLQIPGFKPAIITLVGIPPAVVITFVPVTWQTVGVEEYAATSSFRAVSPLLSDGKAAK